MRFLRFLEIIYAIFAILEIIYAIFAIFGNNLCDFFSEMESDNFRVFLKKVMVTNLK